MPEHLEERRAIQRDWLGHGLQLLGVLVIVGVPMMVWGVSISTTVATQAQRADRADRDISDLRQSQTVVNTQLIDVSRTLTRIDTQLTDILAAKNGKR